MKKCLHQKVLASAITLFLSLVIIVSSISVFAEGNSEIVFPETTASLSGGWGSGASNPTYSANGKSFTLSASPTSSGYTAQFQCLMYIDNFSSILKNSKKIAFDFYPTFTNQNGADSCWLKYSFDQVNWSGDFANPLKNGEKYTLVIDTSSVPSNASFIALQFQNYGNQISSDAVIIGSAPYIYEAGTAEPTTPGTTQPSQSGEGFDPNTITFKDTVATLANGWGAGAANPMYLSSGKGFKLSVSSTSSGYTAQFQCLMDIQNFSTLLKSAKKIAFDIYPTFKNQNGNDSCYLKYSFDQATFSGDFANPLKTGEKYTVIIDTSTISSTASFVNFQFQNYGNNISDDAVIIGSAPYVYEAGTAQPTTPGTTKPSQSGEGFDPDNLTFEETVASITKNWEADCSLMVAVNKKSCTFIPNSSTSGYRPQFQGSLNLSKFSNLVSSTTKIAFDIYPTFKNESPYDKNCYVKYSFDQATFSGDFANPLQSGKKYTITIDCADIPSNARAIQFIFQNYGSAISDDAKIIVSAPYACGVPTSTTTEKKDFPSFNSSKPYFRIKDTTAPAESEVSVPIEIGNNPGLFSAKLNVSFDTKLLTFKGVKAGNVFTSKEILTGPVSNGVVSISFESSSLTTNNTKNGTLATLLFEANSSAALKSTKIAFANYNENDYINASAQKVGFTFGNGTLYITKAEKKLSAPANFKVTQVSNSKATVSWNAVAGASGYEIYRKTNSGKFETYKTIVNGNTKSFTDTVAAGNTYTYKVRAFSTEVVSPFTAEKAIKTYKLAAVKKVTAKAKGKKVTIGWKSVNDAQKYQVFVSTKKKSGYKLVKTVSAKKVTVKLKSNKKYFIKVRALRTVGTAKQSVLGNYSSVKTVKTK